MRITFLGTAAATAFPLVFCRCPVCQSAWRLKGRSFRRRSSALIDSDLLIDLGPDIMSSAFEFGIDISRIRFWLQTHSHSDHFDAGHLITRIADYATKETRTLELCASPETLRHMSRRLALEECDGTLLTPEWQSRLNLNVHPMSHGAVIDLDGRRITAVESNHDPLDGSLLWAVEEKGASFLYATDTMQFTDNAIALFRDRSFHFDAVAIDHTYGSGVRGAGHLDADGVTEEMHRLKNAGVLTSSCRFFATHISHEGMPLYDDLHDYAAAHGYEIAYDGMIVEI